MSPELLAHAMEEYLQSLQHQVAVARAFYFDHLEEGLEGFLLLPEDVRLRIDQLLEDVTKEEGETPMHQLLAAVMLYNLEERMGMQEEENRFEAQNE